MFCPRVLISIKYRFLTNFAFLPFHTRATFSSLFAHCISVSVVFLLVLLILSLEMLSCSNQPTSWRVSSVASLGLSGTTAAWSWSSMEGETCTYLRAPGMVCEATHSCQEYGHTPWSFANTWQSDGCLAQGGVASEHL